MSLATRGSVLGGILTFSLFKARLSLYFSYSFLQASAASSKSCVDIVLPRRFAHIVTIAIARTQKDFFARLKVPFNEKVASHAVCKGSNACIFLPFKQG
jgi:hypothetical protein